MHPICRVKIILIEILVKATRSRTKGRLGIRSRALSTENVLHLSIREPLFETKGGGDHPGTAVTRLDLNISRFKAPRSAKLILMRL